MKKIRIIALLLLVVGFAVGAFVYYSQDKDRGIISNFPFKLGLDLNGGTHLVYQADTSKIQKTEGGTGDIDGAMESLRQVIEARINAFGVAEPIIQTEKARVAGQDIHKLVVELPGVTDIDKAVQTIGQTPILEFKLAQKLTAEEQAKVKAQVEAKDNTQGTTSASIDMENLVQYVPTGITGQYLKTSQVQFDQNTSRAIVSLEFNDEGRKLFAELTKNNIGNVIAIFLDGQPISTPVVRDEIRDGKAVISGNFTPEEARDLSRNLRYGALPVPISLIGTQTIGASLGADALKASVAAGLWGLLIIALFLLIWYRLPGLIAIVSLCMYTVFMLAIFKLVPVVLTSAGLAGFILSIGMAVDGNILIFERMKEELAKGHTLEDGIREGFARAWLSIRDSNLSSIITSIILYTFATSALIKGFALVFFIGVVVSMFTAITVSRTFLLALGVKKYSGVVKFLFGHGLKN